MRTCHAAALVACMLIVTPLVFGQQPSLASPDISGPVILQHTLRAMGISRTEMTTDTVLVGAVRSRASKNDVQVTIKTKGPERMRWDAGSGSHPGTAIINAGAAATAGRQRSEIPLDPNARNKKLDHLPGLMLAYELQRNDLSIEYLGIEEIQGRVAHRCALSRISNTGTVLDRKLTADSRIQLWIDAETFTVLKMRQTLLSAIDTRRSLPLETHYGDYRNISGMLIPFRQVTTLGGVVSSELTVQSFALAPGLSDAEFEVR